MKMPAFFSNSDSDLVHENLKEHWKINLLPSGCLTMEADMDQREQKTDSYLTKWD